MCNGADEWQNQQLLELQESDEWLNDPVAQEEYKQYLLTKEQDDGLER